MYNMQMRSYFSLLLSRDFFLSLSLLLSPLAPPSLPATAQVSDISKELFFFSLCLIIPFGRFFSRNTWLLRKLKRKKVMLSKYYRRHSDSGETAVDGVEKEEEKEGEAGEEERGRKKKEMRNDERKKTKGKRKEDEKGGFGCVCV